MRQVYVYVIFIYLGLPQAEACFPEYHVNIVCCIFLLGCCWQIYYSFFYIIFTIIMAKARKINNRLYHISLILFH